MYEFQVLQGRDAYWYWRLWSTGNNRSIAVGGESYFNEANARRAVDLVKAGAPGAPVRRV